MKLRPLIISAVTALLSIACGTPEYHTEIKGLEDALLGPLLNSRPSSVGLKCLADKSPERNELFLSCAGKSMGSSTFNVPLGVWGVDEGGLYRPVNGKAQQWVGQVEEVFSDRIGANYPNAYEVDISGILSRTWPD